MKPRATTHTWITRSAPKPNAAMRLFCFPYAGGGSVIYHHWGAELPDDIEVCAVKLPGRENRLAEPPFVRIAPLVQALAKGLTPYFDRPFAFFGHSLGGFVSFELTHELWRQQRPTPVHLLVSAIRAPHVPSTISDIHDLPTPAFIDRLRTFQGTPEAILNDPGMMELIMPVLRADFAIAETYAQSTNVPLACPITALYGLQDDIVSEAALRAWQCYTRNLFTMHTFEGDHFFIHHARAEVLEKVRQTLLPHLLQALAASGPNDPQETGP
ncbi:putative thioesterase [Candidatus Entotheonella serta]|nr:putative thioesterase [Candidatus Entotheonella serta]